MLRKIFPIFCIALLTAGLLTCTAVGGAEKYNIKEMTPGVQTALENRRARYAELQQLKQAGKVGENNQGYITAFSDDSTVARLVKAENQDRLTIYRTIAEQNNLQNALSTIEAVFAATQREKAQAGDKIQLDDGSWTTKK